MENWSGGEDKGKWRSEGTRTTLNGSRIRVRPGRELALSCVWQHLTWAHVLALLLYPVWHRGAPEWPVAPLKCLYSVHTYDTFCGDLFSIFVSNRYSIREDGRTKTINSYIGTSPNT